MAKKDKKGGGRSSLDSSHSHSHNPSRSPRDPNSNSNYDSQRQRQRQRQQQQQPGLREWLLAPDRQGLSWLVATLWLGGLLGFLFGAAPRSAPFPSISFQFRSQLAGRVRSSSPYQFATLQSPFWDHALRKTAEWAIQRERELYRNDPAHPRVWAVLREAVVREKGGYVHPDLGLLHPAPSGAVRGLGMVQNSHYQCQTMCFPASQQQHPLPLPLENLATLEDDDHSSSRTNNSSNSSDNAIDDSSTTPTLSTTTNTQKVQPQPESKPEPQPPYQQEQILIRVPLSFQMTRTTALALLVPLIPTNNDVHQRKATLLHELDDAALLTLQLAHERGVGRYSRWLPYIAALPQEPTCGYSRRLRSVMLDALTAYRQEHGVEADGWSEELVKAMHYAERIADALKTDFGQYLTAPPAGITVTENIQWALCQVASRAIAGYERHGSLRLVPVVDLINHDAAAGAFIELTGKERRRLGDFMDAMEDESGTFVVRSMRHGRWKPLKRGQELLANYNVPLYTPLDWFVSLGFVPYERWGRWVKLDPVLPQVRRDGPFSDDYPMSGAAGLSMEALWKAQETQILQRLKNAEL